MPPTIARYSLGRRSADSRLEVREGANRDPSAPSLGSKITATARMRPLAERTERAYTAWIRRFLAHHGGRHPLELGKAEIEDFLSDLALRGSVSASTQNQALSALLFLYRDVYGSDFPWLDGVVRARRPKRLPVVLTRAEVSALLAELPRRPC